MKSKPDYRLVIKIDDKYLELGCAWLNQSKSISVLFNPFVQLPTQNQLRLTLFPKDYIPRKDQMENDNPNVS